jgi:hypothetical protein
VSEEDQEAGKPTGTRITYDPDSANWFGKDKNGNSIDMPPQTNLEHELTHAARFGEGTGTGGHVWQESRVTGYPLPPAQEQAGTASDAKVAKRWKRKLGKPMPSENDLRKELGLPERGSYGGSFNFNPPPRQKDLRPGKCP